MQSGSAQTSPDASLPGSALPGAPKLNYVGRQLLLFSHLVKDLGAFALITLGVTVTKFSRPSNVILPQILRQIYQSGLRMMPVIAFLGVSLALVIVGQLEMIRSLTGASVGTFMGIVFVTVVVRELGVMIVAVLLLARMGTAHVIELGTARATGEIEALESLGIDPVHYLVMPRVIGLAVSVLALTIYLNLITLVAAYLFAFLQDIPLQPGEFLEQIGDAMHWQDFIMLALKPLAFGTVIAIVSCYQGLARPLRLEQLPNAAIRSVMQSVVICVLLDVLFIVVYYFF